MRKPFVLNTAIRLISAEALLISVMTSPIRPNVSSGISNPEHLRHNFGIPGKVPANHRPHAPVPSRVVQVKALSSESKLDCLAPLTFLRFDPSHAVAPLMRPAPASSMPGIDLVSHALRC
jgi:hypothetical protein